MLPLFGQRHLKTPSFERRGCLQGCAIVMDLYNGSVDSMIQAPLSSREEEGSISESSSTEQVGASLSACDEGPLVPDVAKAFSTMWLAVEDRYLDGKWKSDVEPHSHTHNSVHKIFRRTRCDHISSRFVKSHHSRSSSSLPMTTSRALLLSATLCSSAPSFAMAAMRLGSPLSTLTFSLTRTSCPL